jgi:iron(II)-dependent oxidoreductase
VHIAPLFLDRYAVTNRRYYEFVAAGGYRDMTLWDQHVWAAVLDLIDQTGQPGPAFWQHGRYLPGEEELPVVGVSWYEAQACARWMGKRLPTDAEWVKAACWPVATDGKTVIQRRYPWGDGLDRSRANLWGSGPNRVVAVTEFSSGASVGGIYQLIGNVWEWNASDFHLSPNQAYAVASPLKSIHGGAFDTYLDNQATCQFESGEYPLNRRHNIGFRCAIGTCDLVLALPPGTREDQADAKSIASEVVHA